MGREIIVVFVTVGCCVAWQRSEIPGQQEHSQIVKNMRELEVSITLDRAEYLPGEDICPTVEVANPTSRPIRSFAPFRSMDTSLFIQRRTSHGEWEWSNNLLPRVSYVPNNVMDGRKVIEIGPGRRMTETTCLGDTDSGLNTIRHNPLGILPSGEYRLAFSYERPAFAEFRVAAIEEVAVGQARLPFMESLRDAHTGVAEGCMGVTAAALRKPDSSIVLVVSGPRGSVCWPARHGIDLMNALGRYSRVGEVREGVKSLSALALPDGSIELSLTDDRAYLHRFNLPRPEITFDASGRRVLTWQDGAGRRRSMTFPARREH
jgi:hypothetical protein